MDAAEFRLRLENVKEGDTVIFVFKRKRHWATHFLALLNSRPLVFEVSDRSVLDFYTIYLMMEATWVSTSSWPVICNVLKNLEEDTISIDWIVEQMFLLLDDFIVQKALKPE
jgi:hypothetical protein